MLHHGSGGIPPKLPDAEIRQLLDDFRAMDHEPPHNSCGIAHLHLPTKALDAVDNDDLFYWPYSQGRWKLVALMERELASISDVAANSRVRRLG